jgi:lambda family phage tail tape measure protein
MGDALMSMVDGTKSVKDAFKSMAAEIIKELYRIYVVKQITGMISGGITGFLSGGTLAGGYSPGGKTYGSGAEINAMQLANGGAFYGGNVIPFASGGVVSSPINFGMSGGRTGLMGEAGPEAIMPLKRGANGKLGVQAEGGAGDVIIHQNFNFTANGDESVKKLIAQAAPQIANMTKSSIISDRRRGGQIKATFG